MRKRQLESSPVKTARLDVPLECQYPEDFGDFDKEQFFLLENNALDLVLVENAAELMRRVMMAPGNIEKVLDLLSKRYQGCGVLPAETFPIFTADPNEDWQNTGTREEYMSAVEGMREQYLDLRRKRGVKCISAVFGLMVEEDGSGHYGSFYLDMADDERGGRVFIFDSMQDTSEGSAYTQFFSQLAQDIFRTKYVVFDRRFDNKTSLQLTGGFSQNPPLMLRMEFSLDLKTTPREDVSIKLQSTESQNHFCYMWSIWSLHLRMLGKEPFDVAQRILDLGIDPLTVIKRYIWALFNFKGLRLISQIPAKYREFFSYHWPVIWSNDPIRRFRRNTMFRRYVIPLDSCNDISDCAKLSYEQLKVIREQDLTPLTEMTQELIECARKGKKGKK